MPIKNLVVNGCSYTDDRYHPTWATMLAEKLPGINYYNLASGSAGNDYICKSTINFLADKNFVPDETLVLIMWSGTLRKDLNITGDWWYNLQEHYPLGRNYNDQEYYVFSGGGYSWTKNPVTRKIFGQLYKTSDPTTLCHDSLMNFVNLENYLIVNRYKYKFTNYINYWHNKSAITGDYCIGFFSCDDPLYKSYDFSNWFFANTYRDGLSEFASSLQQLDETWHPTQLGHQIFCDQVVIPNTQKLIESMQ